ncbi:MAG: hypothetical protein ACK4MJ_01780 [Hylemonella sp.]
MTTESSPSRIPAPLRPAVRLMQRLTMRVKLLLALLLALPLLVPGYFQLQRLHEDGLIARQEIEGAQVVRAITEVALALQTQRDRAYRILSAQTGAADGLEQTRRALAQAIEALDAAVRARPALGLVCSHQAGAVKSERR